MSLSIAQLDDCVDRLRSVPQNVFSLRAERKQMSRQLARADRATVIHFAHAIIDAGLPRFVAYELVLHHAPAIQSITEKEIEDLGKGMSHWAAIDSFGCFISGPAWRHGCIRDTVIARWARSPDWCWRRAALVSTVPLNLKAQGGTGDTQRTLAVCRMLLDDREDLVVKALSWALRALSNRDPESVKKFVSDNRDRLAARVRREVGNKLDTGLKSGKRR